jgi:hypothetical protein
MQPRSRRERPEDKPRPEKPKTGAKTGVRAQKPAPASKPQPPEREHHGTLSPTGLDQDPLD